MSAEVESSKEEETKVQPKTLKQKILSKWQIGIKILELLFCLLCIGTVVNGIEVIGIGNSDPHHVGIMYTAYTGYVIINLTILATYYLDSAIPYKTSCIFTVCGATLFLTTAVLLIVDRSEFIRRNENAPAFLPTQLSMILVSVFLALVNAAIFTVDTIFTLLCAACVGFMYEPLKDTYQGGSYIHHTGVIYTAYTGFILINLVLLIGKAIGERIPFPAVTLFAIEGALMFLIAGGLLTDLRRKLDQHTFHPRQYLLTMMTISLSCAFANSVVFCIDAFCVLKTQQDL